MLDDFSFLHSLSIYIYCKELSIVFRTLIDSRAVSIKKNPFRSRVYPPLLALELSSLVVSLSDLCAKLFKLQLLGLLSL